MLLTAWVGMLLASPAGTFPWYAFVFGTLGIGCAAASGAAINHLVERHIDIHMRRTQARPIAKGRISPRQGMWFALILGSIGLVILIALVNTLTACLTFFSLIGYALIYLFFSKEPHHKIL